MTNPNFVQNTDAPAAPAEDTVPKNAHRSQEQIVAFYERYKSLLLPIKAIAPEAHIAGGAIRDLVLNRRINDIDLFVGFDNRFKAKAKLKALGYVQVGEWVQYQNFSDPNVFLVGKFYDDNPEEGAGGEEWHTAPKGSHLKFYLPVSLIVLKKPLSMEENIKRFDFGICMAAYDGHKHVLAPEFEQDRKNLTFTLLRADNYFQFEYSKSRYDKFKNRFENWDLVVPEQFKEYYDMWNVFQCRKDWQLKEFEELLEQPYRKMVESLNDTGSDLTPLFRLRALEDENAKLKRLLADAMPDNAMLKEIAAKKG